MKLSFYTPISYDFIFALKSIMSYYSIADEVILAIDIDRISWSNKKFEFDESFFKTITEIDVDKKIKVIESNFHRNIDPIINDTEERNYILKHCSNYTIAIDSDEILLNAIEFKNWLTDDIINFDLECIWKTVYKVIDNKILVTIPEETAVIGTPKTSHYKKCRITGNKIIKSPLKILHYSWGRTPYEVEQKLINWTHSKEFDIKKHLTIWNNVSLSNYMDLKDFHPLKLKTIWKGLKLYDFS